MIPQDTFGNTLRFLRKRARLTQDELGRAVGYSRAHIALLERDRRTPDTTVVAARFITALSLRPDSTEAERLISSARRIRHPHRLLETRPHVAQDPIAEAVAWYLESNPAAALRLTNTLVPMWYQRGRFGEARKMLEQVLARTTNNFATHERLRALIASALFAQQQGDAATAIHHAEEALTLAHQLDDAQGIVDALTHMGWATYDQHNRGGALALFERKLIIGRERALPHAVVDALLAMANVSLLDAALRPLWEDWLAEAETMAGTFGYSAAQTSAAVLKVEAAIQDGIPEKALTLLTEMQRNAHTQLSKRDNAAILVKRGEAYFQRADDTASEAALREAQTIYTDLGDAEGVARAEHHIARIDLRRNERAQARIRFETALQAFIAQQNLYMQARCHLGLASCAHAGNDLMTARQHLKQADALMVGLRPFLSVPDALAYNQLAKALA